MPEKYDVVIIGGGHNGLIVGCYLLKAGLSVCVIEEQDHVGGGVYSAELTLPGFILEPASAMHGMITANPLLHRDELQLKSKYNLKYIYPEIPLGCIFKDETCVIFYQDINKTYKSIEQISKHDADAYIKFKDLCDQMLKIAHVGAFSPPPTWGAMMSLFDSSPEGREYLRIVLSSGWDILGEWFESEKLKLALSRFAAESFISPVEKGTGNIMFFISMLHRWGWAMPKGGSGELARALKDCLLDNGGKIKCSSPVKSVITKNGEAKGVIIKDGDEIEAKKAVVSNVNVKQLFLNMLNPDDLPRGFTDKVKHILSAPFSCMIQAIALNEAPIFKAGLKGGINQDIQKTYYVNTCQFTDEYLKMFELAKMGFPCSGGPTMGVATLYDPSRAPAGKHTLYLAHIEPYNLRDGGAAKWDEIKIKVADDVLKSAQSYTVNLTDTNILARYIVSPYDIYKSNHAMLNGDIGHIGGFLSQSFANRPLPGWGRYRTPIKKLYMCGASTHPGLGVTGGGRAAVIAILEDLGLDFKKILEK
jgi:phytoene dehydrogenase-like protein